MAVSVSVTFTAGIYSGHTNPGESSYPPSPGRLIAAFLNEISRRNDTNARTLLDALCVSGSPMIVAPPAYSSGEGESYMQAVVSSTASSRPKRSMFDGPQRIHGQTGGKLRKVVNGHRYMTGPIHFIWESAVLDAAEVARLDDIAAGIPYLGRECDLAAITVTDDVATAVLERAYKSPAGIRPTTYRPNPTGPIRLRAASQNLLSWLDDRHTSIFGDKAGQPIPEDHRVRVAGYAPAVPVPDSDKWVEVLALQRPLPLAKALAAGRHVDPGAGGVVFPVTRSGHRSLDGHAVGLGVLTSTGTNVTSDFDTSLIGADNGLRSLQPSYWTRSARRWMTAVPFLAHPDRWVATMQVAGALPDAEITGISITSLRPSQAPLSTAGDDHHRAWHITLTLPESVNGPLILDRDGGTGVLMPDYLADVHDSPTHGKDGS